MLSDQQKPVIVLAFANDRSDQAHHPRNLPDELRRIADRLQIAEKAGLCEVVVRTGSTVNELLDVFQDRQHKNRIAVFHFSGHAGAFQLLVDAVNESPEYIHSDNLIEFIGQQDGLQLVFLNGCATISHAEGLMEASVPAVIATAESIEDDLALELSSHFYAELAGGASIHTAYQEAVVGAKKIHDARPSNQTTQNGPIEFSTRDFILPNSTSPDQWPWDLYLGEGSEFVKTWNLPAAFEDSLLGLPDLLKQDLPTNPYRHLHWFREEEAELFFGRDREIRALFEMVTSAYAEPIVLFYGHTGVGKSSILASGLLPRINQTHESFYIRQQIELGLTGTLAHGLNILNPSEATAEIIKVAWLWHETKNKKPLVVVLDQVEEIFTRLNPEQLAIYLKEFLDVLNHLFMGNEEKPAGKLVLGFRKEWLPDIETACKEAQCHFSKFLLKRLDKNGIMEAIEGISRSVRLKNHYGLDIEKGLSALIANDFLEDVASPVAPALQLLLTKMWQAARLKNVYDPEFTTDIYHSLKQRGVLLGDFLNEQLDNIHQRYPEISNSGFVLDVIARHTTTRGTAATCTIEVLMDIYDHEKKRLPILLKEFKELHLIEPVEQQVNGLADQATRLAHDILAPLIQQLYRDSDRPGQRARRVLESYVPEWDQGEIGATLDEADLQLVEAGKSGMHNWTNNEQRLILASRRSRAKRKRVRNRIRMGVVTAVALITAFGFYVSKQQGLTEESRDKQSATQTEVAKQEALDAQALAEQQLAEARHLQLLAEANVAEARRQESLAIEQETIQQQIPVQNAQRADEQRGIAADRTAADRTASDRTVTDRTVANRTMAVNLQRRRPLGLALSSKALLRLGKNDNKTAALLAREAFQFNKEGNGIFVN
ncbi:MAG: CHAT domain-containing protein, partial [Rhodothermales bacterium]